MQEMNRTSFLLFIRNSLFMLFMVTASGFLFSCGEDLEPLTTNSVLKGKAYLAYYDETGYDGIRVLASGPYGQTSTLTDTYGHFTFSGLGNGTYFLEYSKDGCGTLRQYGIRLFGYDTVWAQEVQLFKIPEPDYTMPSFISASSETIDGTVFIIIETSLPEASYSYLPAMLFLDVTSEVSWKSYEISYPGDLDHYNDIYINSESLSFKSGTRVYVIGYICNPLEYSSGYLDTYLGISLYSTLDPSKYSNVVSFIMP